MSDTSDRYVMLELLRRVVEEAGTVDHGDGCDSGCCRGTAVVTKDGLLEAIRVVTERERVKAAKQRQRARLEATQ